VKSSMTVINSKNILKNESALASLKKKERSRKLHRRI
jgi:hypothetical protein